MAFNDRDRRTKQAVGFDENLAARVRRILADRTDVEEKRMFGGVCFLVGGSMSCGVIKEDLCVRIGPEAHDTALAAPHTRPMDFTGRPMRGFVYVEADGLRNGASLRKWVRLGVEYALLVGPRPKRKSVKA